MWTEMFVWEDNKVRLSKCGYIKEKYSYMRKKNYEDMSDLAKTIKVSHGWQCELIFWKEAEL